MSVKTPNAHRLTRALLATLVASVLDVAYAGDNTTPADTPTVLHPLVVTGTRIAHDPMDLPASVQVINREQAVDGQARVDLTEDTQSIAGLQSNNRHNYAQDVQISSRGFGARSAFGIRSLKLFTDGIPASMADGQGQSSTFNLDQTERIEVMQGPMSAIYGNQAGGVIQLFTREGKGAPTVDASVESGSYGTWKQDSALLGSQSNVSYLLDESRFKTDGYRPDSAATRDSQMAKFGFAPTDGGKVTFVVNTQQSSALDPLGITKALYSSKPFGALNTKVGTAGYTDLAAAYGTRKSVNHIQEGVTYDQTFGQDHLQMTIYNGNRHVVQFQSSTASATSAAGVIDYARDFYGADIRWISVRNLSKDNTLTFTGGISNDRFEDNRKGYTNFTANNGGTPTNYTCGSGVSCGVYGSLKRQETDNAQSTDPYVQAEWAINQWLLTGGLRYSHVNFNVDNTIAVSPSTPALASGNITYAHTTPMLSAVYKINSSVNVYASAAGGFETPTMNEMFYSRSTGTTIADRFNFGLKAADTRYYELGMKTLLNQNTESTFALYHILVNNEAVVDVNNNGSTAYKNADTQRDGVEWNLNSQITPTVNGKLSLTVMRAFYPNAGSTVITAGATTTNATVLTGSHLPGVAEKSAYAEMAWEPIHGVSTAAEFLARGRMFVEDTNTATAAGGYATAAWRLVVHQEISDWKFKEFARVDNLFNRTCIGSVIIGDANGRYYETAPGRNWLAGVSGSYSF